MRVENSKMTLLDAADRSLTMHSYTGWVKSLKCPNVQFGDSSRRRCLVLHRGGFFRALNPKTMPLDTVEYSLVKDDWVKIPKCPNFGFGDSGASAVG